MFCARHSVTNAVVDWFQVDVAGTRHVCADARVDSEVCSEEALSCEEEPPPNAEEALEAFLWEKDWQNRLALNRIQPKLVRNFTDVGYEKMRIPDELLVALQNFFHANSKRETTETIAGPVMNQNTISTYMTHLGSRERRQVEEAVKVRMVCTFCTLCTFCMSVLS
jgi:hypothetical protein